MTPTKCGYVFKSYNRRLVDIEPGHEAGLLWKLHYLADIHVRLDSDEGWDKVAALPEALGFRH